MSENVDDFLAHFGVKGMKWGVRRATDGVKGAVDKRKQKKAAIKAERKANFEKAREAGYTDRQRVRDYNDVGKRGVRKIEKRIANGEKINVARFKVSAAHTAKGFAVAAAILGGPAALVALDRGAGNLASNINAKRGAEAAAKLFADNKGLASYKSVALTFDAATNTWK